MTELDKGQRWEIAEQLDEIPTACWSDLVDWVFDGYSKTETDDGEIVHNPVPDVTGGAWCATAPDLMRSGCCYCGKFRAGVEVTDGRA
ncbi:hypothetical protein IU449_26945 [Nocardia higoensis]|uniref:Uncharacterized protein n=1 Tax=Nocardia higoensis TaxID=228599 RepID=A0ABS0DN53_9NOCA|nr:hypothetical protein [Nocardia higoensis]MBF6358138.1 hypothetical protein [Nocardia higoensis]